MPNDTKRPAVLAAAFAISDNLSWSSRPIVTTNLAFGAGAGAFFGMNSEIPSTLTVLLLLIVVISVAAKLRETKDTMSEKTVQQYLINECKYFGGVAVKVECSSIRGWMDMNVVLPWPNNPEGATIDLVECKSDTGKGVLSDQQIDRHAELLAMGYTVPVLSSKLDVDTFLYERGFIR
jgi:hypothetical protein